MTTPRRKFVRPAQRAGTAGAQRVRRRQRLQANLERAAAALARWQKRLQRAFRAVAKHQQQLTRLNRQLHQLDP